MSGSWGAIALGVVMVAVIVGLDVLVFREHAWARLLANIGVVLLAGAFYLRYVRSR